MENPASHTQVECGYCGNTQTLAAEWLTEFPKTVCSGCGRELIMTLAYRVTGHPGVAWSVWGFVTTRDEEYEWTGMEYEDTGRVRAHMIGDDYEFQFGTDELEVLGEDEYCSGCGQIGCGWC